MNASHKSGVCGGRHPCARLSVVIPTLNEEPRIVDAIRSARQCPGAQIIVVDGGSTDDTTGLARAQGAAVVRSEPGRGRQLARGAEAAGGDTLLFLHADTRLPPGYWCEVERVLNEPGTVAGAFRMAFDHVNTSLRLIEWGTSLRSRWRQLPYGDQALFLRRSTYRSVGGFKPIDSMEDFDLVWRLRRHGRIRISPLPAVTSARKYLNHGPWRTVLLHQRMIWSWLKHRDEANNRVAISQPKQTTVLGVCGKVQRLAYGRKSPTNCGRIGEN